jgi:hypothetical protein
MPEFIQNPNGADQPQNAELPQAAVGLEVVAASDQNAREVLRSEPEPPVDLSAVRKLFATEYRSLDDGTIMAHFKGIDEQFPQMFIDWRQGTETGLRKRPMPLSQWLSREPDAAQGVAGATDEQLLNVLQWSVYRLQKYNQDPELKEQVAAMRKQAERLIGQSVDSGLLSPKLYVQFQNRFGTVPILIGDVFDEQLASTSALAVYKEDVRQIVIRASTVSGIETIIHEGLHDTGGFLHRLIDEAATEKITQVACTQELDLSIEEESVFQREQTILGHIGSLADISVSELSELYTGDREPAGDQEWESFRSEERTNNQERFRQLVVERYGADLLGLVLATYDDEITYLESDAQPPNDIHEHAVSVVEKLLLYLEEQDVQLKKELQAGTIPQEQRPAYHGQILENVAKQLKEQRGVRWQSALRDEPFQ